MRVRLIVLACAVVAAACAPSAVPGGRITRRLQLAETPLPAACGADAVFGARSVDVQFWYARDGGGVLRFLSREPLVFGPHEVSLPEGLWADDGSSMAYLATRTSGGVMQAHDWRFVYAMPDGGAASGELSFCTCDGCADCRTEAGACAAKVRFSIEASTAEVPAPPSFEPVDGARVFDVAVQTSGAACAATDEVTFEVWQRTDAGVTLPATRYGIDGGVELLRPDGDGVWRSEALSLSRFEDALENKGALTVAGCGTSLGYYAVSR